MEQFKNFTKEELIAIIVKQNMTIAILKARVHELEQQLNQNSSNSSKPPSSDGLAKPTAKSLREKTGKKPGGQKGHKGHGLKIEREPDEVIIVEPVSCTECGATVQGEPTFHADTRYVYDVQIEIKLTKYDIREAVCPECGSVIVATPPPECKGTINYGNTLRALCVVLTNYAYVSIDKTRKILRDVLDVPISGGTIKNIMREFASKTDSVIGQIKERLKASPVLNVDETGVRVAGRTQWIHAASNAKYTLVNVHQKRGREGSESGGVLGEYTGIAVHDCWKPYFGFDKCEHAICCAHLLRELNAQIERGQLWASEMKALLLEMKKVVERYKEGDKTELSRYYHEKFKMKYDGILEKAKAEIVPSRTRKKTKGENLLSRLEEYHVEITRFTDNFDVPFDNNQAERDIRNVKVKQKVSGSFRTEGGAEDFAKTSSVIGTVVKFGQSVLGAVKGLFSGDEPKFEQATE